MNEFVWPTKFDENDEHLSASSINQWFRCEVQYGFRRGWITGEPLKMAPGPAMVQGRGLDAGVTHNFTQKIESTVDLPLPEVLDVAAETFDRDSEEVEDWGDTKPGEAKDVTVRMMEAHHEQVAPRIQPVAVQEEFWIYSDEWQMPVMGYLDVRTATETRDTKGHPKGRAKSQKDLDADLQAKVYLLRAHVAGDPEVFVWDQVTPQVKSVKIEATTITGDEQEYDIIRRRVKVAEQGIDQAKMSGILRPADPSHFACGYCGYRPLCPYVRHG